MGVRQLEDQALTTIGTEIKDHEVFKLGIFHESVASKVSQMKMARSMISVGISVRTGKITQLLSQGKFRAGKSGCTYTGISGHITNSR